jgi:hypothetical protein
VKDDNGTVIQKWSISGDYLLNNSGVLELDESKLNNTIDDRDSYEEDTSAATECSGSQYLGGNGVCQSDSYEPDTSNPNQTLRVVNNSNGYNDKIILSGGGGEVVIQDDTGGTASKWVISEDYLVNNSGTLVLDENKLNSTIDTRDSFEADTTIPDTNASSACGAGKVLKGDGNCVNYYNSSNDGDSSSTNEIQDPTVSASGDEINVSLSDGGSWSSASIVDNVNDSISDNLGVIDTESEFESELFNVVTPSEDENTDAESKCSNSEYLAGNGSCLSDSFEPDTKNPNQTISVVNNSDGYNDLIQLSNGGSILVQDDTGGTISKWPISEEYLVNSSGTLKIDESKLNSTIDTRDSFEADTLNPNQSLSIVNGTDYNQISLSGGNTVVLEDDNGTVVQKWSLSSDYLVNSSGALALDESRLNSTIDARDDVGGSSQNLSETLAVGNVANQTINTGSTGVQIGNGTTEAHDGNDVAIGLSAFAKNVDSPGDSWDRQVAIGKEANASGGDGIAIGPESSASAFDAVAIGQQSSASGSDAVSIGRDSSASGGTASALTSFSIASGLNSVAIGPNAEASGEASVAIGNYAKAPNNYEATFGNLDGEELDVNVTGNFTVHGVGGVDVQNGNLDMNQNSIDFVNSIDVGPSSDAFETVIRVFRGGSAIGAIDNSGSDLRFKAYGGDAEVLDDNNNGLRVSNSGPVEVDAMNLDMKGNNISNVGTLNGEAVSSLSSDTNASTACSSGKILTGNGNCVENYNSTDDDDSSSTNEIQGVDEVLEENNTATKQLNMSQGELVVPTGDLY